MVSRTTYSPKGSARLLAIVEFDVSLDKNHLERLGATAPLTGLIELIWNSIDADASEIKVVFGRNALDGIDDIRVVDDGHGMGPDEIEAAFGMLGASWKRGHHKSRTKDRALHGRDGRGRYRAGAIGNRIRWRTIAADPTDGSRRLQTTIELRQANLAHVVVSEPEATLEPTGTTVIIDELAVPPNGLNGDGPPQRLTATFALALQNYNVHVVYDGQEIDPSLVQADRRDYELSAEGSDALLTVVEWTRRIDRGLYLCDESGTPLAEQQPGIQAPGFEFTAYLQWTGFRASDEAELMLAELGTGESKRLIESARDRLREHFRDRTAERTREQIRKWKAEDTYPFKGDPATEADRAVRDVFDVVALSASNVVNNADTRSRRFSLHLLKEALEQDPGSLHRVLKDVLDLPPDRLEELSEILEHTPLTALITLAKKVAQRLEFLRGLEELVLNPDIKKFVKERSELHKILAGETWVFGEEYALAINDESLSTTLQRHIEILGRPKTADDDSPAKDLEGHDRILDLMLSRRLPQARNRLEHLVIELKAPHVKVGDDEAAQIRKYATAVAGDQRFDTKDVQWDFIVVSSGIKGTPEIERESDNRPFGQIMNAKGIRVWVLTWADVIEEARHRLKFVQTHLDYQPDATQALAYLRKTHEKYLPRDVGMTDSSETGATSP
jgi:hypothetical protein